MDQSVPEIPFNDHPFVFYERLLSKERHPTIIRLITPHVKRNVIYECVRLLHEDKRKPAKFYRDFIRNRMREVTITGVNRPYPKVVLSQALTGGRDASVTHKLPTYLDAQIMSRLLSELCDACVVLAFKTHPPVQFDNSEKTASRAMFDAMTTNPKPCVLWYIEESVECVALLQQDKDISLQLLHVRKLSS